MHTPFIMWIIFCVVIAALFSIDLINQKNSSEISIRKSIVLSTFYICVSLAFSGYIYTQLGSERAYQFLAGWFLEKMLALDNIILISSVFLYFKIPIQHQRRVLFFGIIGAIFFRILFIGAGTILVAQVTWILILFSILMIILGIRMLCTLQKNNQLINSKLINFIYKKFHITDEININRFFVMKYAHNKKTLWFTPLFVALIVIECTDIVFAMDSLPAIFAITTDPYIVFTSNMFAVIGLRSLYSVLSSIIHRFSFVNYLVAVCLIFLGITAAPAEVISFLESVPG